MFTDNILQFKYSYIEAESDNDINVRRNPFLNNNDLTDFKDNVLRSDISYNSLAYNYFDENSVHNTLMPSVDNLAISIKECKRLILNTVDDRESKEKLIETLTQLNEQLYIAKESRTISCQSESLECDRSLGNDRLIFIGGHSLVKIRQGLGQRRCCEACSMILRTALSAFRCRQCIVCVHDNTKCLRNLYRRCPASNINRANSFPPKSVAAGELLVKDIDQYINIDSFPLTGNLTSQQFLCAECNCPIRAVSKTDLNTSLRSPAKLCNYYRRYYCSFCHWDNKHLIPSFYFMLNKWKKMPVCRRAYISLTYLWDKALFRMPLFWESNNPKVQNILIIRRKLFSLRIFIHKCEILKKISGTSPEWIVDQPYLVTMRFVEGFCDGVSLETVQVLYSNIIAHIPQCETCRTLCHPCHICGDPESLYHMSGDVWPCNQCFVTCVHENCGLMFYKQKSDYLCPDCTKS